MLGGIPQMDAQNAQNDEPLEHIMAREMVDRNNEKTIILAQALPVDLPRTRTANARKGSEIAKGCSAKDTL